MSKAFTVKRRDGTTRTLDREAVGNKLFDKMWQNQSDFTMKSINNSGLTKDEIKKSWIASWGFAGLKENIKDDFLVKMILGDSKFDTGYKNVGLKKAYGAFKTVIDSIIRTKPEGNKGNVPRKTLVKASLFKKKNGKEIASISLTKKK
tara:strand:+ start:589 stop:1032 length:444 start_codon:yes stop_codon:yes gene_type:complete